jgi:hypothetical protein
LDTKLKYLSLHSRAKYFSITFCSSSSSTANGVYFLLSHNIPTHATIADIF